MRTGHPMPTRVIAHDNGFSVVQRVASCATQTTAARAGSKSPIYRHGTIESARHWTKGARRAGGVMVAPSSIKDQMEVVGSDGVHVGVVDQMESADRLKLTSDDPDAGGEEHFIPLAWVDHVDSKIHLKQAGAEARARWKTH